MSINIKDYLENEDIIKVANKAASSFSSTLSRDEIQSCILSALWKAKTRYKSGGRCKLTSFIHQGVVYECLTQRKFNLFRIEALESLQSRGDRGGLPNQPRCPPVLRLGTSADGGVTGVSEPYFPRP